MSGDRQIDVKLKTTGELSTGQYQAAATLVIVPQEPPR